jgi:glycerol kinase
MSFVLALDQGTTSSRVIVFDRRGRALAASQQEFAQHYPRPGWVEHQPADLWSSMRRTALGALTKARLTGKNICSLGITNQRETTLLWERATGRPLHPAIVWQDRRTADFCARLKRRGLEPLFTKRTGLVLDPYFSGTKLRWLLDNIPGARRRAEKGELAFGTVDSWLLWQLTEGRVHATDVSNASRTLLLNLHSGEWDEELLKILRIPREVLPAVRPSSGVFGEVSAVRELRGVPIAGIAGDQQAALFGQACWSPGMAKNTYGTGCFLLMHTGEKPVTSKNKLLSTIAWKIDGRLEYALEGGVFIGGAVVQWLRDGLGLITQSVDVEKLAARVPDNGGVYLVPAFAGLGAPHWDANARGLIVGLTRGSNAAHLARAALESIAYQSADLLRAMEADCKRKLRGLRVDGGAVVNNALMQFQADLLRVPVVRPRTTETTALGAAYLAGLAVGFWKSRTEIAQLWSADRAFRAEMPVARSRQLLGEWRRAVNRAKSPEAEAR